MTSTAPSFAFPTSRCSAAVLGFGVLWALLVYHLSVHWNLNPQYGFGWFVPVLGLYLFARRFADRPAPTPSRPRIAGIIFVLAVLAIPPTWILAQPNPDWRLVSWMFAFETVAASLIALYRVGGWSWTSHFAFPVCFLLVAIPWPTAVENAVIQNLMAMVASVTVEALNLANIAAVQRGNLIEVRTGILGVDDACSGVRSLQATLMAALFLGELFRFRVRWRVTLLVAGVGFAFICNIGRAFFLAQSAAKDGPEAIARWHDPAGYTILFLCFAGLCGIAFAIHRLQQPRFPEEKITGEKGSHSLPAGYGYFLLTILVTMWIGTEFWYRLNEQQDAHFLTSHWPEAASEVPIAEEAKQLLQYDDGTAVLWRHADGTLWRAFAFEWDQGARRSTILARMHRPDICLPASGMELREDRATVRFSVHGQELPFRSYTFESAEGPLYVFFCVWRGKALDEHEILQAEQASFPRLRAVAAGERNPGQQVFEFVLSGYASPTAAEEALQSALPSLLR